MQFTHNELVDKARKWLSSRSPVTITELATNAGEEPDVIAFCVNLKQNKSYIGYGSVLIECKASRSDYLADKKKMYRRKPENGMGDYRYYMAPLGLIKADELPEKWGLLEIQENGRIKMIKIPERQESNKTHEITVLISTLRRLNIDDGTHISIKKYTYETKNRASLTIHDDIF